MNLRPFPFCPVPLDLVGLAVENRKKNFLFTNVFELSEYIDSRFDGGEDSFSCLLSMARVISGYRFRRSYFLRLQC
jgi:hypothetical protein